MTMEQECADHWFGPRWSKRRRRKWQYSYAAMAKLMRSQV